MKNNNQKQNIQIATMDTRLKNLQNRFERFVDNDFEHLRKEVREIKNWLFFGFIALIAITIITQIVLRFFA